MATDPSKIIANLNSLHLGEMDSIRGKLQQAREDCVAIEQAALAERLVEAAAALSRADVKTYRKRVESVISQLGHLR